MTFLVIILFALTLYFSQNRNRIKSEISKKRSSWFSILVVISIVQLIMIRYSIQHLFLGLFIAFWAVYTYKARKQKSTSWKGWVKVFILVLSSFTYLSSVNLPYNWEPIVIQLVLLVVMIVLQGYLARFTPNTQTWFQETWISKGNSLNTNTSDSNVDSENKRVNKNTICNGSSYRCNTESIYTNQSQSENNDEQKSRILFLTSKGKKKRKKIMYWIDSIVLLIIVLPFIVFIMDKAVDGYKHYYHSVQNIGKVEEYDSTSIDSTGYDTFPVYGNVDYQGNTYYHQPETGERYVEDEYYNMPDTLAE